MSVSVSPTSTPTLPKFLGQERQRWPKGADEAQLLRAQAHQFQALMQALPLGLGVALIGALIVAVLAAGRLADPIVVGWLAALSGLALAPLRACWSWQRRQAPRRNGATLQRWISLQAGAMALLWATLPAHVLGQLAPGEQLILAGAVVGMLCSGALTLAAMPAATWTFLAGFSVGALSGVAPEANWLTVHGLALWLLFVGVSARGAQALHQMLLARAGAEARVDHQHQLIGLLLRDFEEQGSDVLWEIDAKGQLCHVSRRLADALRSDAESLTGRNLRQLLAELQSSLAESERESTLELYERLTEGHPFRDVMLPLVIHGQPRWWSMTAKPLLDEHGSPIGWRGVARDVTQSRQADRRLAWMAHFDALTGLHNRAHFRVLLEQALNPVPGQPAFGAVVGIDIDNFKSVNDTLGHSTGDALLVEVARRIRQSVGKTDVVARLSGDEFGVLLRHFGDEDSIRQVCERITRAMREPCQALGATVQLNASIGVARFPHDGTTVDEILQNTDLALYDAKTKAGGAVHFFAPHMGESIRRRLVLEHDLRDAMEHGQLSLQFQPKVNLRRWEIQGFEALLRWTHPEHGEIPPNDFIPVAEESGLILPIGEWALHEACRQAASWPATLQVAVNISPVQVMAENLPQVVQRALQISQLPAERLELEITESVLINEARGTGDRLHKLRALGVRIALDDFGTGYSSLAYLRRFPFDTLKIDRAFVRELLLSRDARSIVRNILALARSLRMTTVAEGVEEPAQAGLLEAEACDLVQGFFVSRPLPAHQVAQFIADWGRQAPPRPVHLPGLADTDDMDTLPLAIH